MHTKNPLAYSQEKITFGLKSVFVATTAGDVLTFLQIFLVIVTTNTTKVFPHFSSKISTFGSLQHGRRCPDFSSKIFVLCLPIHS